MFVVCGDFNNARCLGKLSDKFDFKDYVGKAQCNYNLNIIKDSFDDLQFEMADIGREEQGIPTHYGYIPDDHIFIRGLNIVECKAISACELSDHDIICATVELND
jgi:endonuclease/exonuclease/phosphatase family metal-dependent hydrolase